MIVLDLETGPILPRPKYPPEPVGLAYMIPGAGAHYLAFGHPTENNCERGDVQEFLEKIWSRSDEEIVMHNASFDLSVLYEKFNLPPLPWHRVHDTIFLIFLNDPHADKLGLKEASEALLGWEPEERDEVYEWLWEKRADVERMSGRTMSRGKKPGKNGSLPCGAFIGYAPGRLVGRYARGDVKRTWALFQRLYDDIRRRGMQSAYDRERRLLPILMENEKRGLRVDVPLLDRELIKYKTALVDVEDQMREYLGAPTLDFDNDRQIAQAFVDADIILPDRWVRTPKSGQLSVSKENLTKDAFADPLFADAFGYRNRLVTCLKMFMIPWLEQAWENNNYIFTNWNQVKNSRSGDNVGTRTGRPSMTKPNLLNVAKSFDDRKDEYQHPAALGLPPLPLVRRYILPDPGHLWLHRDFSGQELRVFAHFESGDLMRAYQQNPNLDPHDWVRQEILRLTGKAYDRTSVKVVNFQSLYGGGIPALQKQLRGTTADARQFKAFHDQALPGRKILMEEIQRIVRRGDPIYTWGGREYYVEPPSINKKTGRIQNWEYKLINYLVQGSSADITKEVICRWYYGGSPFGTSRFLLTVYDEINISAPEEHAAEEMQYLRECMENVELDVPMLSDGKIGPAWGILEKVE